MLIGKQSWVFENHPVITATGVSGGPFEANGNLAEDFDILHDDLWMGQDSYEKAQRTLDGGSGSNSNGKGRCPKGGYRISHCW